MSVVNWAEKPEPWRSIGLRFVEVLERIPVHQTPEERREAALTAGDILRDYRRGKGWPQKTLAYYAKCSMTTIVRIENGLTRADLVTRGGIAAALGVAESDIWK